MFDFAWSEIALIGVVALVVIGPKDMPVAIKAVAKAVKKAKSMASEFQTHVDEMVREADLHEVRDGINSLRRMDLRGHLERTVDPDGSIRSTLRDDPFKAHPTPAPAPASVSDLPAGGVETAPVPDAVHVAAAPAPSADARPAPSMDAHPAQPVDVRPAHEVALPSEPPPPANGEAAPPQHGAA